MSQNYAPTKWIEDTTVGTASVMNNMERGIKNAHERIDSVDSQIKVIENEIGSATLNTSAQDLKGAINEVFQNASNGKKLIAQAITGMGVDASENNTFEELANKILQISGSGTEIIGNDDTIQLSDIVSYYQEPTQNIANEINALGGEYVSFIVATDTHGTTNANNSQNIIRYLLKNTKARRFFHLGDVVGNDWDESHYHLYFNPFEKCIPQVFYTLGNHEWQNGTANDHVVMYRELLSNKSYLQGNPEGFYYYFDDTDKKIRYLVINTSDGNYNAVTSSQLTWIRNSVQLPTPEWNLIVFGHIDIMPNDPITSDYQSNAASSITNALSSTNGTIIGYFCGHEHIDRISKVNDTFYQTILLNDSCAQETSFTNIKTPTRTLGTVSEQAISIVSINLNTHVVTIRRIGAGENLTYTYTKGTSSSGATYTITRNLTNCTSSSSVVAVVENASHTETFTANTGYALDGATVTITMGGTDISSSYSNGTLNIASVTGDIIITISAIEKQTSGTDNWIDGVPYNINLINDEYVEVTGEIKAYSGWSRTDYLKCNGVAKLGFLHCTNSDFNCFYDENKNFISKFSMVYNTNDEKFVTVPSNAVYFICSASTDSMDGSISTYGGAIQITPYAKA